MGNVFVKIIIIKHLDLVYHSWRLLPSSESLRHELNWYLSRYSRAILWPACVMAANGWAHTHMHTQTLKLYNKCSVHISFHIFFMMHILILVKKKNVHTYKNIKCYNYFLSSFFNILSIYDLKMWQNVFAMPGMCLCTHACVYAWESLCVFCVLWVF